ncbi:MAG TPA: SET domain-containing protein-lysine N-methyltransferase [Cyclobacteriaceae bacterium]|jgi:D-alanine-D-alanine ligase-like ATP-grasp enzyme|nr:SET domain-containing protein-lysine N-methyltransferase [Cytophagales bacterium]HNT49373.1 SET domain-containing protein-lysine N-methyltransferase [Cyclobacteriaceae bacterium]HRE66852.1 SET domain-containing protein-lysine N-methyltransferase [Cyclobacteriaceae bacterium]HRF35640.1 SET domain-containing protein-lysine N-methyltransferase [Cyclobacteriaceae bacterium]
MKVCVLQPDYNTTEVDYKNYDPPRNLAPLLPNDQVDHVFLNKLTTYKQLKDLRKQKYDIYVNLCEGYLDWSVPSIDVINAMDTLNLPYTGPNAILYDPPKPLMKYVAYCAGIKSPLFAEVNSASNLQAKVSHLTFPLFVKPAKAGDSLGVDEESLARDLPHLQHKVEALLADGYEDILIEEYIAGQEFTVLVTANMAPAKGARAFKPVEYKFPKGYAFKTYALKTSELHTDVNKPCTDPVLETRLKSAAEKIFTGFAGVGYARLDFRVNEKQEIYFLEINFTCSVFYEDGYEGSADYILQFDPIGKAGFLKHIIEEGKARYIAKQKKYRVKGNAINGYGIVAQKPIRKGETVFKLEEAAQRIVTKRYVEQNWTAEQIEEFRHYAYPISDEVYILWDNKPENWAPQNHSCAPNTTYQGLNLVALRDIEHEEELTLDYADLLDDNIQSFVCTCGHPSCRKIVSGRAENSITQRAKFQVNPPQQ